MGPRLDEVLRRPTAAALLAVLAGMGCGGGPEASLRQPPVDRATGVVLDDAEAARRVARNPAPSPEPPPPFVWRNFDDAPVGQAAVPAAEEDVDRWIRDLGADNDEIVLGARHALLHQGLRVSGQLRNRAAGTDRGAERARELTAILGARLETAWSARGARGWVFTSDGEGMMSWTTDTAPGLERREVRSGRLEWSVTPDDIQKELETSYHVVHIDRFPEPESGEPGTWRVLCTNSRVLEVSEKTGALTHFLVDWSSRWRKGRRFVWAYEQPPELPPDAVDCPGRGRVSSSGTDVLVTDDRHNGPIALTTGALNPRVITMGANSRNIVALTNTNLLVWNWSDLKLVGDDSTPRSLRWLVVCAHCGRVVVAGPGCSSFGVLPDGGGSPVRVTGQFGGMTAMASDPQGRWIATADSEGFIRLFVAGSLERISIAKADGTVESLRYSPDGRLLVATVIADRADLYARTLQVYRIKSP